MVLSLFIRKFNDSFLLTIMNYKYSTKIKEMLSNFEWYIYFLNNLNLLFKILRSWKKIYNNWGSIERRM